MIKSTDLNKELKKLEEKAKDDSVSTADVVKGLCLVAKVLRDMKSNQVLIMEHEGIKLRKSKPVTTSREQENKSEE